MERWIPTPVKTHPLVRRLYHQIAPRLFREKVESIEIDGASAEFVIRTPKERDRVNTIRGEEQVISRILSESERGDVLFDIGANIGTHTCLFADSVGPDGLVVAVEPEPANLVGLHRNVKQNGFEDRVAIVPYACGAEPGFATLFKGGTMSGSGTHSLVESRSGAGFGALDTATVPVVTLDGLSHLFASPDMMKIDVEGFEMDVIAGGRRSLASVRSAFIEEHDNRKLPGSVISERSNDRMLHLSSKEISRMLER